jgi:hypothetical protein
MSNETRTKSSGNEEDRQKKPLATEPAGQQDQKSSGKVPGSGNTQAKKSPPGTGVENADVPAGAFDEDVKRDADENAA